MNDTLHEEPPDGPWLYISRLIACSALLFSLSRPSRAQTTTIDFDPPQFSVGQVVQNVGIVSFPDSPVVFAPGGFTTFTPPDALQSAQVCANALCSSGAYMIRMYFSQLLSAVSVRAGNFGTQPDRACIPEGSSCPVFARLVGFNVSGTSVGDSGDIQVGDAWNGSIQTALSITDASGSIAYAILYMNKGTAHSDYGNPVPAQIDHLVFTSTGVPTPTSNSPPTIAISAPTPLESFSYPFHVTLSGKVTAPAGSRAFCMALNNTVLPPISQCNQLGSLDVNGNFSFGIQPQDLSPGSNTLSAFVYDLANQSSTATVTFSLQAPPPPSIVIFAPSQDYCLGGVVRSNLCWLNGSSIQETGSATVPGGLLAFCTGANESSPPSPSQCNQTGSMGYIPSTGTGSFNSVSVPNSMIVPGANSVDAWVYDRWGQLGQAHVNVVLPADPQIVGMEVTQGIQTTSIPLNTPGSPVPYSGVKLFAGGKTIVRVFANTVAGIIPDVDVLLLGTRDQYDTGVQSQLLGLLFADNGTKTLTAGPTIVSLAQRADPNGAYVFTLPSDWVSGEGGSITLYAVVNPAGFDIPPVPSCPGCKSNSLMTVTNVTFNNLSTLVISPVALTWSGQPSIPDTNSFQRIASVSPLSGFALDVRPFLGMIDVSDLVSYARTNGIGRNGLSSLVADRVSEVEDIHNPPGYTVGVMSGTPGDITDVGLEYPQTYPWPPRLSAVAVTDQARLLTSVGHEFFHELHYYHAGTSCGSASPSVGWPPDGRGDIQGIGLDRSTESAGTYPIIAPGAPGQPPEVVDLMSYCAGNEGMAWISVNNWNAWGSDFPNGLVPCDVMGCTTAVVKESSPPVNQQTLRVNAMVDITGKVTILRVSPGDGRRIVTTTNTTDTSSYFVVVRDAQNAVVSRTRVTPMLAHQHDGHPAYLTAEVTGTGAASVEIESNGAVAARRVRSAHPPTITILSPSAGTRLSGKSPVTVKWLAQDADGDVLSVRVEYSTDDGKTFRVLTTGVHADRVSLPAALFSRSAHARIRVRVNDGFNEALAVSDPLTADGSDPTVVIIEPASNAHYRNDVPIYFTGRAYDDAGNPIPPDWLDWYDGDRPLGHGAKFSVFDREPGQHTIRLVARDGDRQAAASINIYIDPVAPRFVGLKVPDAVDHGEDEMRLTTGSSIPGVLAVGIRGYTVETKPRELTIPIPKGKDDLSLTLVLVAEGKTNTIIAHVKRK